MNRPRGSSVRDDRAGESRRLFFALWPDAGLREQLAERIRPLAEPVAGRLQRPDQWHVTLEFLGAVPVARLPDVHAAAAAVRARSFELVLDTIEHWRQPAVLCLAARDIPRALDQLVVALRLALASRDFEPEWRPYRPHLTLARHVRAPPVCPPPDPLTWPATEFVLVESTSGRHGSSYQLLGAWPLA